LQVWEEPLLELKSYNALLQSIRKKITPVLATGVIDVQQTHMVCSLLENTKKSSLFITYSESRAKEICEDMQCFHQQAFFYPAKDILFYSADVHSKEIQRERFRILERLLLGEPCVLVLSVEALLDKLPERKVFEKFTLRYEVGEVVSLETLLQQLITMGYERSELVEGPGQFSVRGGILDFFSPTMESAVRIEFWDDEIDSIRNMDVFSQRSMDKLESVRIFPARELIYEKKDAEAAANRIQKELETSCKKYQARGMAEEAQRLSEIMGEVLESLREGRSFGNIENYTSFFYPNAVSLLDYFPEDTLLFFDEPERIRGHMDVLFEEYSESIKSRIEGGYLLPSQGKMLFDYTDIVKQSQKFSCVLLSTVAQNIGDFQVQDTVHFSVRSTSSYQKKIDLFCEEVSELKKKGYQILIYGGSVARCERMVKELEERDIVAAYVSDLKQTMPKGSIWVVYGRLSKGFVYRDVPFAVFSDRELLGEVSRKPAAKKKKKGTAISSFTDLKIGDYVVHDTHGIGIFRGLEKISVDGIHKDYMKISYANDGALFIPVNQMDVIQKYIGSNAGAPKLNKLGGQEWNRAKTKARSAVKILAEDLVALYAKRAATKGYKYSPDTAWQKEFEDAFPFEETQDQLTAIEEVKKDMESDRIMDRLICGDVGYGKTEVAIRAAFKAVQDGKQVAYLVPTTILSQQHYHTFVQRMADYPVRIVQLSRFATPKQQKIALQELKEGIADIVIGTHRILSKDVTFKNLGLVIVDEEQRFGVSHKEKLKSLKENLDVLTLTATPIPRTLHMSLAGIRDMSILEEPPQERRPIQTYVMESNPEFIREAIQRELNRGGQVYYLHNRVDSIAEEAIRVQNLVPGARVAYAHGQMTERQLETIMEDFIEGEIDVLVCTTIIETGLDISNVNTIIIQDADRMGLSQLYQLRGRVGRSNRNAYAYLMYRRNKVLQETAEKRLQTIREFTEFGSGFKIAMRDLEIRGAGNLLGAEQHGHMEAVGYDMYCRLLEEEVKHLQGVEAPEQFETLIDMNVDAYIPDFYIPNQEQRMEIYKKIAAVVSIEDYYEIQEEIEDRYGNLPKSVQTLLEVVMLKAEAHAMDILSIVQKQNNIMVTFKHDAHIDPTALTKLITKEKDRYLFTAGANPYLTIKMKKGDTASPLAYVKSLLQGLKG
jgi:transcription-repair coupling factor (superfamily II helicase)